MGIDDAIALTLKLLKEGKLSKYGYDLYPPAAAEVEVHHRRQIRGYEAQLVVAELTPVFLDAAWVLCQRGLVRPGVKTLNAQSVDTGGYSLTFAGRGALQNLNDVDIVLLQPGSLSATMHSFGKRFGSGFDQRSQEAIRCRDVSAWLGCCAMVGAAAESVLLAVAIAKTKDEEKVLLEYLSSGGRRKVLNMITGQQNKYIQEQLTLFTSIISMWRDEASHGQSTPISNANADEALRQLLHMCQWIDRDWNTLIK